MLDVTTGGVFEYPCFLAWCQCYVVLYNTYKVFIDLAALLCNLSPLDFIDVLKSLSAKRIDMFTMQREIKCYNLLIIFNLQ